METNLAAPKRPYSIRCVGGLVGGDNLTCVSRHLMMEMMQLLDQNAGAPRAVKLAWVTSHSALCACCGLNSKSVVLEIGNLEIVDLVQIPAHIAPGKWVLGWRWVNQLLNFALL